MTAAQQRNFFMIVPPGLEDLAREELQWRGFARPSLITKGGLEFQCELEAGLRLNHLSRVGTRVLLRMDSFRCRDFPKLFNKLKKMDWRGFPDGEPNVEVTARRSRLMNKKRIAETVAAAVKKAVDVYVRFEDDVAQISVDTSGEPLFKRGYKTLEALAPLRENLAAGLFFALYSRLGRPEAWELLDPLCGSGTFLTEAAVFAETPMMRRFAYQDWTSAASLSMSAATAPTWKYSLFGFDRHPDALRLARENLRAVNANSFAVKQFDFLNEAPAFSPPKAPRMGIANPPYGVRIQLPAPPAEFYHRLLGAFAAASCDVYGMIVPRPYLKWLPKPNDRLDFANGGIDVSFVIYDKSSA